MSADSELTRKDELLWSRLESDALKQENLEGAFRPAKKLGQGGMGVVFKTTYDPHSPNFNSLLAHMIACKLSRSHESLTPYKREFDSALRDFNQINTHLIAKRDSGAREGELIELAQEAKSKKKAHRKATKTLQEAQSQFISNSRTDWATKHSLEQLTGTLDMMGLKLPDYFALKGIIPDPSKSESQIEDLIRRNRQEWGSMLALPQHDNIVDYFFGGDKFSTMEFIEGILSPKEVVQNFTVKERIEKIIDILKGLELCHDYNITHRDIKPENMAITLDGVAKLIDFGLMKEKDTEMTMTGMISGTPHYMPPEQFDNRVDPRTDIFAIGGSLYYFIAEKRPFSEDVITKVDGITERSPPGTFQIFNRARRGEVTFPEGGINDALKRIITNFMAPHANDRPQTAAEARAILEEYIGLGGDELESPSLVGLNTTTIVNIGDLKNFNDRVQRRDEHPSRPGTLEIEGHYDYEDDSSQYDLQKDEEIEELSPSQAAAMLKHKSSELPTINAEPEEVVERPRTPRRTAERRRIGRRSLREESEKEGLSKNAKIGIGVGAAALGLAGLIGLSYAMSGGDDGQSVEQPIVEEQQTENVQTEEEKLAERINSAVNELNSTHREFLNSWRNENNYDPELRAEFLAGLNTFPKGGEEQRSQLAALQADFSAVQTLSEFEQFRTEKYNPLKNDIESILDKGETSNESLNNISEYESKLSDIEIDAKVFESKKLRATDALTSSITEFEKSSETIVSELSSYQKKLSQRKKLIGQYNMLLSEAERIQNDIKKYVDAENIAEGKVENQKLEDYASTLKKLNNSSRNFSALKTEELSGLILRSEQLIAGAELALKTRREAEEAEMATEQGRYLNLVKKVSGIESEISNYMSSGTFDVEELTKIEESKDKLSFKLQEFLDYELSEELKAKGVMEPEKVSEQIKKYTQRIQHAKRFLLNERKTIDTILEWSAEVDKIIEESPYDKDALENVQKVMKLKMHENRKPEEGERKYTLKNVNYSYPKTIKEGGEVARPLQYIIERQYNKLMSAIINAESIFAKSIFTADFSKNAISSREGKKYVTSVNRNGQLVEILGEFEQGNNPSTSLNFNKKFYLNFDSNLIDESKDFTYILRFEVEKLESDNCLLGAYEFEDKIKGKGVCIWIDEGGNIDDNIAIFDGKEVHESQTTIESNQIYFLSFIKKGQNCKVYLNNEQIVEFNSYIQNSKNLVVGHDGNNQKKLDAKVYSICLFDEAISYDTLLDIQSQFKKD